MVAQVQQSRVIESRSVCDYYRATVCGVVLSKNKCLCKELVREKLPHRNVFLLSPGNSENCNHACSLAENPVAQVEHL